ncbi:MobF family relaxase [Aciditerrimonas ferrireducens]|uniref:MobF family relaxase n=1 Tax=Aciditerrimonas ferrireducens TaxID=667306 RepID=A0ABV6BZT3_9ACTN
MLSIGRIGVGEGYRYLTGQVASQDAPRAGERLLGYYEASGYPPGVWLGRQAEAFGLVGRVDEGPMEALFGRGLDPRDGSRLGRRMAVYRGVEERVRARLAALGREASGEERARIEAEEVEKGTAQAVAGFDLTFSAPKSVSVLFALGDEAVREQVRAAHEAAWRGAFEVFEDRVAATRLGAGGVAQVEVRGVTAAAFEHWYSRAGDPQVHTHVAVSALVQTGDGRWRRLDSRALHRAAAAVGERYTAALMRELTERLGVGWRHRVSGRSGRALPEVAGISDELIERFSARRRAVEDTLDALVREYRERHGRAPDRRAVARLAQQAVLTERPGAAQRSFVEEAARWQAVAAETLGIEAGRVEAWVRDRVLGTHGGVLRGLPRGGGEEAGVLDAALARLEERGATFTEWDAERELVAVLREQGWVVSEPLVRDLTGRLLDGPGVVAVRALDLDEVVPAVLRRADGSSVFTRRGEARFAARRVLDAERALVALAQARDLGEEERAARRDAGLEDVEDDALVLGAARGRERVEQLEARVEELRARLDAGGDTGVLRRQVALCEAQLEEQRGGIEAVEAELARRQRAAGRVSLEGRLDGLGADQAAAIVRLADPSRPLDALIGPAGSGKTTALRRLADAFEDAGRQVHVLAPTAVAAKTLGDALDAEHRTLHAALLAWRDGRDLPEEGDLVLVDEASMASTPMLLEVAEAAVRRGALVRLVGDPAQLKAVGAGGGLDLVAQATGAPELTELRRFTQPWEAAATLGLRRGDPKALDAYFEHERVRAWSSPSVEHELLDAWWSSPAGRDRTLMVASDNETVTRLNRLARSRLLEHGAVQPEGVELADGTIAGVGDLIVTRQNQRLLATRPNPGPGAYVRNHDRWWVDAVLEDGSLEVRHVERHERVRLPAEYVEQHVQLGYAGTGHAVQGRTVQRAEVLVRATDTRWYLYVAASRAREHTTLHVALDELEEEPLGHHPQRSARSVLDAVLARDEPVAATQWQTATKDAAWDPAQVGARLRTGLLEELRHRLASALTNTGQDPGVLHGERGWEIVQAAWALEAHGKDAAGVLASVRSSEPARLIDALTQARFGTQPQALAAGVIPQPGPLAAPDLIVWHHTLTRRLEEWRDQHAKRLEVGEEPPTWAATLGTPPRDPQQRAEWARRVAHVALYRAAWGITGDEPLGPPAPLDTPQGLAQAAAARSVKPASSEREKPGGAAPPGPAPHLLGAAHQAEARRPRLDPS